MVKYAAVGLLALGMVGHVTANGRGLLLSFDGGIGVIPASNGTGTMNADGTFPNVTRNIVRGVNPPGQPWRIETLRAQIFEDGQIKVRGRGLLLAGGNGIGTNREPERLCHIDL